MANIFDYLKWRGDLSFSQDAPNAVDALIFSALSYIHFGCHVESNPRLPISLSEAAQQFFSLEDHEQRIHLKNDSELLRMTGRFW